MKNILISSAGQRVVLVQIFQRTLKELGLEAKVFATDKNPELAPACYVADESFKVPCCGDEHYLVEMLNLCQEKEIGVIIPTIDPELSVLASNKERFMEAGVLLAEPS